MRKYLPFLKEVSEPCSFYHKKDKEIESPQDKIPIRAVPETRHKPDNEQIKDNPCLAPSVPSEWYIQIVPEPSAQRHMPSPPVFRYRRRGVRQIKIPGELKPKHLAKAYSHHGIAVKHRRVMNTYCCNHINLR